MEANEGRKAGAKGGEAERREGVVGFQRNDTAGASTLRMHLRNPFPAYIYIHFRCDEVGRRETEREIGLIARTKRDTAGRRRQLGQTLNNLDNGRTALNSCRFVQANRLIRLAGRLQRGSGWDPGEFSVPPWKSSESIVLRSLCLFPLLVQLSLSLPSIALSYAQCTLYSLPVCYPTGA